MPDFLLDLSRASLSAMAIAPPYIKLAAIPEVRAEMMLLDMEGARVPTATEMTSVSNQNIIVMPATEEPLARRYRISAVPPHDQG